MLKQLLDKLVATLGLFLLSPLFFLVSFFIHKKFGKPILFKQVRPGKNGQLFTLYKFRTMKNATDKDGNLLSDVCRLTKFGKFLRSTSLDELPELFNVLKGEMSLVGPRPLLSEYLPLYSDEQAKRHNVLPGITGWAQINGRNNISWQNKFELDLWYVDNQSFGLDLKILFLTILKVLKRSDINQEGQATAKAFNGNS